MEISPNIDAPHGRIRSIAGTNPAANTEISETVPARKRWRLLAIQFPLVTDANAANRMMHLTLDDGTTVFYTSETIVTQTASLTRTYALAIGAPQQTVIDAHYNITLPDIILSGGFRIKTVTTALQATDNFGAPQLLVEEWIDP